MADTGIDAQPRNDGTHPIVSRQQWLAARADHLTAEKEFTRRRDELSRQRRELPWTEITKNYRFEGANGERSLPDLFGDADQLIVYHFMFGPDWEEGCVSCSFWADSYNGTLPHLRHRSTAFAVVSRAPLDRLLPYRDRMGWTFDWFSSLGSDFNYDFGVSFTDEQVESGEPVYNYGTLPAFGDESPGLSVFRRDDDRVFLTYQTFARGLDMLNGTYHHLDLTSKGRDEQDLPWSMAWLHRNDAYPG